MGIFFNTSSVLENAADKMKNGMKSTMEENSLNMMKKQRDLQLKIREMQLATQFAMGKDRFHFFAGFYFLLLAGTTTAFKKTGDKKALIPLLPTTFIFAYNFDMFYLNKMKRIQKEASRLMRENPELFYVPEVNNVITLEEYKLLLNQKK